MGNIPPEERERLSPVWDVSQERAFTMTLINQRIQFFLVFFSAVVGGALNARLQVHMSIILCLGAIILLILGIVIFRTQTRLNYIMNMIEEDCTHPHTMALKLTKQKVRIQPIVSYALPLLCCVFVFIGTILSLTGILVVK